MLPRGSRMVLPAPVGSTRVPAATVTEFITARRTSWAVNFTSFPRRRASPRSPAMSASSAWEGCWRSSCFCCSASRSCTR